MSSSRIWRQVNKSSFGKAVFYRSQQWLFRGVSSSERVERNEAGIEIDFSSDQAMRPVSVHKEGVAQEVHLTGLAGAPQVNDPAARMRLEVELPRSWKGPAERSLLDSAV